MGFRALVLAALSTWATSAAGAAFEIQHQPLDCVPLDRFARVVARAVPPEVVRGAELQFRAEPDAAWYTVPMRADGGGWSAVLPRTARPLARFEYRVAMSATTGEEATPAHAVRVADEPGACASEAVASLSSSIVVRVPPGAPLVPPVPAGFNPAGVVAAQEREAPKSRKTLVVLGSVAAAGAAAGLAAAGSSPAAEPPPVPLPEFAFNGTQPNPGNTISLSRGGLQVFVLMSHEPARPLDLLWRVEWRQTETGPPCVTMAGFLNDAQRPPGLLLVGQLVSTGRCGTSFEASVARITIDWEARHVMDVVMALPFRFVP